ncbi:MAG: ABC transporter permease [Endomicrobium sp.]|jgi:lipoprotein-releasing system permease protein|nr:ABC transporter permease [Endomicrobium sp.]
MNNILSVEFFVALRYLKARRKNFFSILTTFIALGGTALGVAVLIITLAVMSGFQSDIRRKILGIQSHIMVTRIDGRSFKNYVQIKRKIDNNKNILSISPFIFRQGIIRGLNSKSTTGILVKAINYESENKMLNFSNQIIFSDINFDWKKIGGKSIILGSELAKNISVNVGDRVILMFPDNVFNIPKMYEFFVSAIVQSGMYDFDSSIGFVDLEEGQKLFLMQNEVTGLDVYINNFYDALKVSLQLQKDLSYPYMTKTWIEMNKNLFSALKLEKIMMFLILLLIIIVAAFNIVSNLLLLSFQKSRDIGIMSAIGFSRLSISKIFFYEGLIVGFIGIFLGFISGLLISFILKWFNVFKLPKGVYYIDKLPITIVPMDVVMVVSVAFIITVTAGIYPAYQVSKLDPLEAIRYG